MSRSGTAESPLLLRATYADGTVSAALVHQPPSRAAIRMHGLTPAAAVTTAPRLFASSSQAHGIAAGLACSAAAGEHAPDATAAIAVERELAAEAMQEHLWRLLLDWPPLFGIEARRNRYAELHRRLARPQEPEAAFALGGDVLDLVARELLAGFFRHTREPRSLAEFVDCAGAGGNLGSVLAGLIGIGAAEVPATGVPVQTLPPLDAAEWAAVLGGMPAADFCAAPVFGGEPAETGPFARHRDSPLVRMLLEHGHRIAARLLAKVIDLADCASRLRRPLAPEVPALADAAPCGPGIGLACVETARGLLLHAARIDNGLIAEYAICTPTEWNFHPSGSFVREGTGWTAASQDAATLRLNALILALDPGMGYQLEIARPGARRKPSIGSTR